MISLAMERAQASLTGEQLLLAPGQEPGPSSRAPATVERPTFEAVYRQWFHHVVRWSRALGGPSSDLDDLAQDVFMVVRRKLDAFDGANLPGWLFRITANTVSDQRRRGWFRRWFNRPSAIADLRAVGDPGQELELRERQKTLYVLLDRITEKRRTVFVLFEVEELTGEEIAQLLEIPLATVWTRLFHARKELARLAAELEPR